MNRPFRAAAAFGAGVAFAILPSAEAHAAPTDGIVCTDIDTTDHSAADAERLRQAVALVAGKYNVKTIVQLHDTNDEVDVHSFEDAKDRALAITEECDPEEDGIVVVLTDADEGGGETPHADYYVTEGAEDIIGASVVDIAEARNTINYEDESTSSTADTAAYLEDLVTPPQDTGGYEGQPIDIPMPSMPDLPWRKIFGTTGVLAAAGTLTRRGFNERTYRVERVSTAETVQVAQDAATAALAEARRFSPSRFKSETDDEVADTVLSENEPSVQDMMIDPRTDRVVAEMAELEADADPELERLLDEIDEAQAKLKAVADRAPHDKPILRIVWPNVGSAVKIRNSAQRAAGKVEDLAKDITDRCSEINEMVNDCPQNLTDATNLAGQISEAVGGLGEGWDVSEIFPGLTELTGRVQAIREMTAPNQFYRQSRMADAIRKEYQALLLKIEGDEDNPGLAQRYSTAYIEAEGRLPVEGNAKDAQAAELPSQESRIAEYADKVTAAKTTLEDLKSEYDETCTADIAGSVEDKTPGQDQIIAAAAAELSVRRGAVTEVLNTKTPTALTELEEANTKFNEAAQTLEAEMQVVYDRKDLLQDIRENLPGRVTDLISEIAGNIQEVDNQEDPDTVDLEALAELRNLAATTETLDGELSNLPAKPAYLELNGRYRTALTKAKEQLQQARNERSAVIRLRGELEDRHQRAVSEARELSSAISAAHSEGVYTGSSISVSDLGTDGRRPVLQDRLADYDAQIRRIQNETSAVRRAT